LVWDNVAKWTPDKWIEHDYVAWHHYDQWIRCIREKRYRWNI
jgi:hypothetical protein